MNDWQTAALGVIIIFAGVTLAGAVAFIVARAVWLLIKDEEEER